MLGVVLKTTVYKELVCLLCVVLWAGRKTERGDCIVLSLSSLLFLLMNMYI